MAKLPRIDFSAILILLKQEGKSELRTVCSKTLGKSGEKLLSEWDEIVKGLDDLIPKLAEGAEISSIVGPIQRISRSASALSLMASQVLSFVPGPIGIICFVINAVVCFCTLPFPINLCNGFLELLGCIPGGKMAGKITGKMASEMEKILVMVIEKAGLKDLLKSQGRKPLMKFIEKNFKKVGDVPSPPNVKPKANGVGNYGQVNKDLPWSLGESMKQNRTIRGEIKCGQGGVWGTAQGKPTDYDLRKWYTMHGYTMNPLPKFSI